MVKPISLDLLWTLNICLKMFRQLHWEMVSPEKHLPFIYKPDGNGSPSFFCEAIVYSRAEITEKQRNLLFKK